MNAILIILTGSLVAISCSLLGSYLILRKMAMVSDAISHAVLPGIVIAFMMAGGRDSLALLLGAGILGILTTFLIEFFHQKGKLQTDASIGVTFTWLFALGVILVSYYAGNAHIDQDCVLYGEIAYVPLDVIILDSGQSLGPKALIVMSVVLVLILLFIKVSYKELFITTFDPSFANAVGISATFWHYALMSLVSLTTVASFESVGAILVVALLITPPATAYLITERLKKMLIISSAFGVSSAVFGYLLAYTIDGSIAGAMATVAGIQFAIVFVIMKKVNKARTRSAVLSLESEPTS
ncbi:MAG: metal ABC transporter permease [Cyclobacteriaceae bacterium]|nr:metal ABC transporter permease [Cyclobacteriaceae bacterium HetDA_MAG_MS6]